jgi:hypothetical protein
MTFLRTLVSCCLCFDRTLVSALHKHKDLFESDLMLDREIAKDNDGLENSAKPSCFPRHTSTTWFSKSVRTLSGHHSVHRRKLNFSTRSDLPFAIARMGITYRTRFAASFLLRCTRACGHGSSLLNLVQGFQPCNRSFPSMSAGFQSAGFCTFPKSSFLTTPPGALFMFAS